MKSKIKVSVVIPARNEEDVIERCVRSVLNQKVKPYEVIV
ncbi:MAG: glycosyltransferase, partial [Candidatus Micrarchaeia archaeon]